MRTAASAGGEQDLAAELVAVRDGAEAVLTADAAGEADRAARARATEAAKAALDAGHPLAAVAAAEAAGQQAARDRVRPQLLRDVERAAKRVREATRDHEAAIARAARAGLADRQIAERAQIAHATVRSIVRRHVETEPDGRPTDAPSGGEDPGEVAGRQPATTDGAGPPAAQ